MFRLPGTVVSIRAVYSTIRTMVGVSLQYRLHVLLQYTLHGTVVSVHTFYSTQALFLPSFWCVTTASFACTPLHALQYLSTVFTTILLVRQTTTPFACTPVHATWYDSLCASDYFYRIVCIYTLHAATLVSLHPLYSTVPFVPCWYDSMLTSLQISWCHICFFW